ncbi:MAG: two-component system response regulator [Pedosphaera sp.]|nr:two-component system response regulator [Pedosphaera sp.]
MERHLTILIAEDEPNDVLLLRKALAREGIDNPIQVVNDGMEAIKYLQGEGQYVDRAHYPFPSVIFTDIKMPRMGGFEILKWLHTHPDCSVIPVIVLSASAEEKDIKQAYELGANAYLVKPATLGELQEMMRVTYQFWKQCAKPVIPGNC